MAKDVVAKVFRRNTKTGPWSSKPGVFPPVNTSAPVVSGTAREGSTLSCSTGSWDNEPTSYGYQWYYADGDVAIIGATSSSYLVQAGDVGEEIYCVVTATNAAGSASQDSNTVGPVEGVGEWQLAEGHFEPAAIELEIIAPRAGLSTANRYYKAYPGLEYRVPVAVLGGAFPFRFELLQAPSGMTIGEVDGDEDYGVIVWANPTTSGSPHTVEVQVTDQESNTATVEWSITVTTSGFLFVDAVNGSDSNPGTLASPKKTINGWYNSSKTDDTYADYFIYYRAGVYYTKDAPIEDGIRMACTSNDKPRVHLAYPGEEAIIDFDDSHWSHYSNSTDGYAWCGFTFQGISADTDDKGIVMGPGVDDILVFENKWVAPGSAGATGNNASLFFFTGGGAGNHRVAFIGNTYEGLNSCDIILVYDVFHALFERNSISNNSGSNAWGVYLKHTFGDWTIRANEGLSGNSMPLVRVDTYGPADDVEICWNNYSTSGSGIWLGNESGPVSNISDYRNTWRIGHNQSRNVASGNWDATRNVVIHDGSYTEGYRLHSGGVTITRTELLAASSGLIDTSTGLLTGTDRTNFLGLRGHERA